MAPIRIRGWVCLVVVAAALAATAQLAAKSRSGDWPQFRGANRDGVSLEKGLRAAWPEGGPKEVWRRPLGAGFSGISVVGNRLYTMYAVEGEEGSEFAGAFDADVNGKASYKRNGS